MAPNDPSPRGHASRSGPPTGDCPRSAGNAVSSDGPPPAGGPNTSANPDYPPTRGTNAPSDTAYPPTGGTNAPPNPAPHHHEVPEEYTSPIEHEDQALENAGPHGPQVEGRTLPSVPSWAWTQDTNTLGVFQSLAAQGHIDTNTVEGHLLPSRVGSQAYTPLPLTAAVPATRTSSMEGEADAQPRSPAPIGGYPPVQGQSFPAHSMEEDLLCMGQSFPSGSTQPRQDCSIQEDLDFQEDPLPKEPCLPRGPRLPPGYIKRNITTRTKAPPGSL